MGELVLACHVLHELTVSDLLHSAVLAGVDVEPVQRLSVCMSFVSFGTGIGKCLPVRLVVHGRHIALLDHTVLLGEVGFGKCLP